MLLPRAVVVWLASTACAAEVRVDVVAPEGWVSALVAIDTNGTGDAEGASAPRRTLTAHQGPGPLRLEHASDQDVEVVALFYAETLAQLALAPGSLTIDERSTRLPPPGALDSVARALRGGVLGDPARLEPNDARLERMRLPALSDAACALDGRCLELTDLTAECAESCAVDQAPLFTPPTGAEAPRLGPCPAGWAAQQRECVPPMIPTRIACNADEAQHYGEAACARVGQPCPAGPWPTTIPGGRPRRFVDPTRRAGPAGEASFATIADAVGGAPDDVLIVLSRAEHEGGVLVGASVLGACARDTVITARGDRDTLTMVGGELADLTVRGGDSRSSVLVRAGATVSLTGVIVERQGLFVAGRLDGRDVLIRDTGRELPGQDSQRALWAAQGGDVTLSRVVIEHLGDESVLSVDADTRVTLTDVVLSSPKNAQLGARVSGALRVERAALWGPIIEAADRGAVELEEVHLRWSEGTRDATGLAARSGATLGARAVSVDRPVSRALWVDAARGALSEGWLRDDGTPTEAEMVLATDGATLTLTRATLSRFDGQAIGVSGPTTRATLEDLVMRDAAPLREEQYAAVSIDEGHVFAARLAIARALGAGVRVFGVGTATIADVRIDDLITPRPDLPVAGVSANRGSRVTLARVEVRGVAGAGLSAAGGWLSAEDVTVVGPQDSPVRSTGFEAVEGGELHLRRAAARTIGGTGMRVMSGSRATVTELHIASAGRFGVTVENSEAAIDDLRMEAVAGRGLDLREIARVDVRRAYIADVVARPVAPGAFTPEDIGYGARVTSGARLTLRDTTIRRAAEAALLLEAVAGFVSELPVADLGDVTLAESRVGIQLRLNDPRAVLPSAAAVRLISNEIDVERR